MVCHLKPAEGIWQTYFSIPQIKICNKLMQFSETLKHLSDRKFRVTTGLTENC